VPRVSVVIPNYNHGRFLEKRIRSVLDQTYRDFEVIILDDASTDNSLEIIESFTGDPRIRTVLNTRNSGNPYRQWNHGVGLARGEYVWIAEADDYADERLLEKVLIPLESHPNVGLSYCQSLLTNEMDHIEGSCDRWTQSVSPGHWSADYINSGKEECVRYLVFRNTIPNASAVLLRRDTFLQVGGADEQMRFASDWLTWVRMLIVSDLAFVADPLNFFRYHRSSFGATCAHGPVEILDRLAVQRHILRNLAVPRDIQKAAIGYTVSEWLRCWIRDSRAFTKRDHLSILREVRRLDARFFVAAIGHFFRHLCCRLGRGKSVRSLTPWLAGTSRRAFREDE
jgi:glycosyltransferase involved in cell wall biosynthesis